MDEQERQRQLRIKALQDGSGWMPDAPQAAEPGMLDKLWGLFGGGKPATPAAEPSPEPLDPNDPRAEFVRKMKGGAGWK